MAGPMVSSKAQKTPPRRKRATSGLAMRHSITVKLLARLMGDPRCRANDCEPAKSSTAKV